MLNFQDTLIKLVVVAIWFANADSKGYPWDWQSGNAKYPVYNGYPTGHHLPPNQEQHLQNQGLPIFPTVKILNMNTNVSAVVGDTTHLPCRVQDLGEYTVSWLRGRDTSVLSVGRVTFSSDQRFQVVEVPNSHLPSSSDWNLEISQITSKDEGWYDCQVNTEPKLNSKSFLKVFEKGVLFDGGGSKSWRVRQSPIQESSTSPSSSYRIRSSSKPNLSTKPYHQLQDSPLRPSGVVPQIQKFLHPGGIKTEIEGPPVLRLPPGGTLSLQCTISRLNLPPKNLHWKHEKQILTSQTRPGVSLEFEKLSGESHTKLVIIDLKSSDEGTYQCTTDVSRPATVQVFIDSDGAEALASRVSSSTTPTAKLILLLLVPLSMGSIFSHTILIQR